MVGRAAHHALVDEYRRIVGSRRYLPPNVLEFVFGSNVSEPEIRLIPELKK